MLTYLEQLQVWTIDRYREAAESRVASAVPRRPKRPLWTIKHGQRSDESVRERTV